MITFEAILKDVKKNGFNAEKLIETFKKFRAELLDDKKPFLVKMTRLTYEHIEKNGAFVADIWEERSEEDDTSFEYYLTLLCDPGNKYNREELDEYTELFKEEED